MLNLATTEERARLALAREEVSGRDLIKSRMGLVLMLHAQTRGPVYLGTVPAHVIAERRRKNKEARKQRRINRLTRKGQHL